jgi:hypothetical protein
LLEEQHAVRVGPASLEIAGNFASMGIDPAQLFEAELAALTASG